MYSDWVEHVYFDDLNICMSIERPIFVYIVKKNQLKFERVFSEPIC